MLGVDACTPIVLLRILHAQFQKPKLSGSSAISKLKSDIIWLSELAIVWIHVMHTDCERSSHIFGLELPQKYRLRLTKGGDLPPLQPLKFFEFVSQSLWVLHGVIYLVLELESFWTFFPWCFDCARSCRLHLRSARASCIWRRLLRCLGRKLQRSPADRANKQ